MSIRHVASLMCALVLVASASGVRAAVGNLWSTSGLGSIILVADVAPDAGLECLALDLDGTFGLFRLSDGARLGRPPVPFDNRQATTYTVRDFDGNGLAEILCVNVSGGGAPTVGLLSHDGREFRRQWPDLQAYNNFSVLGECRLSPAEPLAIVARGDRGLVLVSGLSGSVLYDSDDTPELRGLRVDTILLEDFNGDGWEEVLAGFLWPDGQPAFNTLIGDTGQASAAGGLEARFGAVLKQNRPNPTTGPNRIAWELAEAAQVSLTVFDAAGRRVRSLVQGHLATGSHDAFWDGRDDAGRQVASGIYFYELNVAGQRQAQKILQVR